MRIVCWNMQYKRASWRFLMEQHGDADIAVLQEACSPPDEAAAALDVGGGPWVYEGWKGARAVVRISDRIALERVPTADIMAASGPASAIESPAWLAAAVATLPGGERIGLASFETFAAQSPRVPAMMREVQRYLGGGLPFIVGADLSTWWDSETTVFADMMRMGLPVIGPHAPTFYSPLHRQSPSTATLQLDYVFASRPITHRLTVRPLNTPDEWGPSDHCRLLIDLAEA